MEFNIEYIVVGIIAALSLFVMIKITRESNKEHKRKVEEAEKEWQERKDRVAKKYNLTDEEEIAKYATYENLYKSVSLNSNSSSSYESFYDYENENKKQKNEGDFLTSAVVAGITDSAILGTMVGGSIAGAVVGDVFFGDDDSEDPLWD